MKRIALRFPLPTALALIALSGAGGSALAGLDREERELQPLSALSAQPEAVPAAAEPKAAPAPAAATPKAAQAPAAAEPKAAPPAADVPEPTAEPQPQQPAPRPKPQPKPDPRPQPKPDRRAQPKPKPRPQSKPKPRSQSKPKPRSQSKPKPRPQAKPEPQRPDATDRDRAAEAAEERAAGPADLLPAPPATTAVPNFVIQRFRIPIFLLPIYQAAGTQYGIRWEVLAAINEIETDYGRNLNVSSAGALGWMQFMPATWKAYGTDANRDGRRDPYNPVDAIFAAARYLNAAGAESDLRRAIFAYNHADWYVNDVLERAQAIAAMPTAMVGALTGLADGRFPVRGRAHYAGALGRDAASRRVRRGESPAQVVGDDEERDFMDIEARPAAKVVSVSDGVVQRVLDGNRIGSRGFVVEDTYGNRYEYLGVKWPARGFELPVRRDGKTKTRFVHLKRGANVPGGTVLGRLGRKAPVLRFAIRPAGEDAPRIDPKPILDGWRLLEESAVYRPSGRSVLHPERRGNRLSVGQALLLPKSLIARRVLADRRIEIYPCGRTDIAAGRIDRRVLAMLAYLAEIGLRPTVTSLQCGHGYYTASGNVSHHSTGTAVDIAAINGVPIMGHQQPGGVTDQAVRAIMRLQGAMAPAQVISLLELGGPTVAMGDHADHIHVGYRPGEDSGHGKAGGGGHVTGAAAAILRGTQWDEVVDRVGEIENPELKEQIEWHGPANLSCKYKRAMAVQGGRGDTKPLKAMADLAAPEKELVAIGKLRDSVRPCFGFGTPGKL